MEAFQDDVIFWSERFRDHAMLMFILIDPNMALDLKKRAEQEFVKWNHFLRNMNPNDLNILVDSLGKLKREILNRSRLQKMNLVLSHGDFLALINHMLEELNYFVDLISGRMNNDRELAFWLRENIEHTELAGHLVPLLPIHPQKAKELQMENSKILQRLRNVHGPYDLFPPYHTSNEKAIELDQLIQQGNKDALQNLLHIMVEHEIKEGIHGEQRIKRILM
jgi:hypothetical protein